MRSGGSDGGWSEVVVGPEGGGEANNVGGTALFSRRRIVDSLRAGDHRRGQEFPELLADRPRAAEDHRTRPALKRALFRSAKPLRTTMASMTAEVDEIEGDQAEDTTDLERERAEDEERCASHAGCRASHAAEPPPTTTTLLLVLLMMMRRRLLLPLDRCDCHGHCRRRRRRRRDGSAADRRRPQIQCNTTRRRRPTPATTTATPPPHPPLTAAPPPPSVNAGTCATLRRSWCAATTRTSTLALRRWSW